MYSFLKNSKKTAIADLIDKFLDNHDSILIILTKHRLQISIFHSLCISYPSKANIGTFFQLRKQFLFEIHIFEE